ncbi:MAG TPA: DNA replication/repair protein RecF [Alphaproteobacteria bacterium]|nr:DNA replication/repair protein RecF [Alphaproteobacteria bacterium]
MLASLRVDKTDLSFAAPLSLGKLTLAHFRNYGDLVLNLDNAPVVLTGANGGGKTNLLEAISLLVPGRGLRRAALADLQNQNANESWAVAAELATPLGALQIGTGRDPEDDDGERRVVHIDGKPARNQQKLAEHVAMAWIVPEMDRILAEGPGVRRKWLDRLVFGFDPAHNGRVYRYEKALRERMRLLLEGPADAVWLNALEDEMAQTGVAIAAARKHMLRQLRTAIAETASDFPQADLALKGMAEEALEDQPALPVEDKMRAALARTRGEDAQSGACATGPHRSDLAVTHRAKQMPAEFCSTGEQKALVVAIMLAYVRTIAKAREMTPLLLLDDIAAHLDDIRREALFEEIRALGVQAFLTGTDAEPFAALLPFAQHGVVERGAIDGL